MNGRGWRWRSKNLILKDLAGQVKGYVWTKILSRILSKWHKHIYNSYRILFWQQERWIWWETKFKAGWPALKLLQEPELQLMEVWTSAEGARIEADSGNTWEAGARLDSRLIMDCEIVCLSKKYEKTLSRFDCGLYGHLRGYFIDWVW